MGSDANAYSYMGTGGGGGLILFSGGSTGEGAYFTTGAVIGLLFDADAHTIQFSIDGTLQGSPYSVAGSYCPAVSLWSSNGTTSVTVKFGATSFAASADRLHRLERLNRKEVQIGD